MKHKYMKDSNRGWERKRRQSSLWIKNGIEWKKSREDKKSRILYFLSVKPVVFSSKSWWNLILRSNEMKRKMSLQSRFEEEIKNQWKITLSAGKAVKIDIYSQKTKGTSTIRLQKIYGLPCWRRDLRRQTEIRLYSNTLIPYKINENSPSVDLLTVLTQASAPDSQLASTSMGRSTQIPPHGQNIVCDHGLDFGEKANSVINNNNHRQQRG